MNQLLINVLVSISARLAEIATYLRLQSNGMAPIQGTQVPDLIKQANLEGAAEEDIWMPRVIQEIQDANKVYNYPTVPADGGHPLAGAGTSAAALQAILATVTKLAPGAPAELGAALTQLTGLLSPLIATIPLGNAGTPTSAPIPPLGGPTKA